MSIASRFLFSFIIGLMFNAFSSFEEGVEDLKEESATPVLRELVPAREYANFSTSFDRVVTIGRYCLTKREINLYFNPDQPDYKQTRSGFADLFDWMIIKSYVLFAEALRRNLNDFFELEDFRVRRQKPFPVVQNTKYSMIWNHLFHKKQITGKFTIGDFAENFCEIKEKIEHLKERFIQARTKKTLYIIAQKDRALCRETLVLLRDSLTAIRQGNTDFMLLTIFEEKPCESFENIVVREDPNLMTSWQERGCRSSWKEILDEFRFDESFKSQWRTGLPKI